MRKAKPKMTKKEKQEYKNNQILNKVCKPVHNVGLILSAFVEYLQEHRDLYDNEDTYIKPYLKGYLTSVIKKTKEFIDYNFMKENHNYQPVKKVIDTNFIEELKFDKEIREEFFEKESEVNCKLFKTYACALICIGTIYDMFMIKQKDPIYNDFKRRLNKIFAEFKIYDNFWQKEIQEINIRII